MKKPRDRGLNYRRTRFKPGIGACFCSSCSKLARFGNRVGMHLRLGTPNPRCSYINREKVFADSWEKENEPKRWLNWGMGILQDLMVTARPARRGDLSAYSGADGKCYRIAFWITSRERVIAATVVQWLGTNVGFSWLCQVLDECGYEVKPKQAPAQDAESA